MLSGGELLAAISNMVVGVYADRLGRGPTRARSYIDSDLVVCLMEGTMQPAERALAESGADETLSALRSKYHEIMREELCGGIERLTGKRVLAFTSGNNIDPDICSELFLLDRPTDARPEPKHRRPEPAARLARQVD